MHNAKRRRGPSPMLKQNREGPYTIVKKVNDLSTDFRGKLHIGQPIIVVWNETAGTSVFEDGSSVTNMECRFPAIVVLWLGRDFYRGSN
ncbi:hypothetical protein AVEN_184099-1 [Araneus ventricosus]|uniref:Uncharacterized protein n=1 Tax=Araneus ventricosus TaxID=182803 RepID=A0A4Y2CZ65_ARAVE|nr:hypothetical protein AVEN_184099-1 [Araneus ventricosus]